MDAAHHIVGVVMLVALEHRAHIAVRFENRPHRRGVQDTVGIAVIVEGLVDEDDHRAAGGPPHVLGEPVEAGFGDVGFRPVEAPVLIGSGVRIEAGVQHREVEALDIERILALGLFHLREEFLLGEPLEIVVAQDIIPLFRK